MCEYCIAKYVDDFMAVHCKNKFLVVFTTERLPSCRLAKEMGLGGDILGNCLRLGQPESKPPCSSYNHNTLTAIRTPVKESLQMHFKVAVRNFHALYAFPQRCLRVVSEFWLYKMKWTVVSQVAYAITPITTISLASLQPW